MTGLMGMMDQVYAEVLTSPERRRRWSREEKLRIAAETLQPGASVSRVARRHGLHPNQVFTWRRQARAGLLSCEAPAGFASIALAVDEVSSRSRVSAEHPTPGSWL